MLNLVRWRKIGLWLATSVIVASGLILQQPALALDAAGEQQILFAVARQDIIAERLDATIDAIHTKLRAGKIGYIDLGGNDRTLQVRIRAPADVAKAKAALADLLLPTTPPPEESTSMTDWAITVLADWFSPASPDASIIELSVEEPEQGLLNFNLTDAGIDFRLSRAIASSIAVISYRIDELDLGEPAIERQGIDRFLVKVSGVEDSHGVIGLLTLPANLTFQLVDQSISAQQALDSRPPAGSRVLYTIEEPSDALPCSGRCDRVRRQSPRRTRRCDQRTSEPVVVFRFNDEGAKRFEQATEENVGRPFAILLDELVISAPIIREPIRNGFGQISGNFTEQSASDLAVLLRSGPLPATLKAIETHFCAGRAVRRRRLALIINP